MPIMPEMKMPKMPKMPKVPKTVERAFSATDFNSNRWRNDTDIQCSYSGIIWYLI